MTSLSETSARVVELTRLSTTQPCWADKFLRIPAEGLVIVPWGMKTIVQVNLPLTSPNPSPPAHASRSFLSCFAFALSELGSPCLLRSRKPPQVMVAWFVSFLVVGHWGLPALAAGVGCA